MEAAMKKYKDNYHDKFGKVYDREFTGRVFNPVEFLHHLTNINFHFEENEISKLSDEAIIKLKARFRFYQYGASVDGLVCQTDKSYDDAFIKLVKEYGAKYGYREKPLNWEECEDVD